MNHQVVVISLSLNPPAARPGCCNSRFWLMLRHLLFLVLRSDFKLNVSFDVVIIIGISHFQERISDRLSEIPRMFN